MLLSQLMVREEGGTQGMIQVSAAGTARRGVGKDLVDTLLWVPGATHIG